MEKDKCVERYAAATEWQREYQGRYGSGNNGGTRVLRPKSMIPAVAPKLNGRWNFVLSKDDLGTQLSKNCCHLTIIQL